MILQIYNIGLNLLIGGYRSDILCNIITKFHREKLQNCIHAELGASHAESGTVCYAELFSAAAHPRPC